MENYREPTGGKGIDTHDYDSKLDFSGKTGKILRIVKHKYNDSFLLKFLDDISQEISCDVRARLKILIDDYSKNSNYDGTNDVKAEDILKILALIWQNVKLEKQASKDFLEEFSIQILDMKTGMCPQGRTIRLWQISEAYIEFLKSEMINNKSS